MSFSYTRYWLLHELRRVRASLRIGNTSEANARKDRKYLQKELFNLRKARSA